MKYKLIVKSVIILFLGTSGLVSSAQRYGNAFGIRLGNGSVYRTAGLTFQQRVLKDFTIEGIAQTDFSHNATFHALAEYHQPIITRSLNYYIGAGLMSGIEEDRIRDKLTGVEKKTYRNSIVGADFIAGLEITLLKINISIDYKPNFNITGRESWYQGQVGVSARTVVMSGSRFAKFRHDLAKNKRKAERKKKKDKNSLSSIFKKINN